MLPNRSQTAAPPAVPLPRHAASGLWTASPRPDLHVAAPPPAAAPARRRTGLLHLHRFRWHGEDPFSGNNLYACRCGRVRPGL